MFLRRFKLLLAVLLPLVAAAQDCPDSVWTRMLGITSRHEWAGAAVACGNGDVLVGGHVSIPDSTGDSYPCLHRLSPTGTVLWSRTYEFLCLDANSLSLLAMGNDEFVLTGSVKRPAALDDICVLRVNGAGDTLWTRYAGGTMHDLMFSTKATSDGGFIVVGMVMDAAYHSTPAVVKLDALGNLVWERVYPDMTGHAWRLLLDILPTSDGGYVMGGGIDTTGGNAYFVRLDSEGSILWVRNFAIGSNPQINCILPRGNNGDFAIMGYCSLGEPGASLFLATVSANGTLGWVRNYAIGHASPSSFFLPLPTGGYLIHGLYVENDTGNDPEFDALLVTTDAQGNTLTECHYGGAGYQSANGAAITSDGCIVLAGICDTTAGSDDENIYVLRTEPVLATPSPSEAAIPARLRCDCYPNPFNSTTEIRYALPRASHVSLRVFDVTGREVSVLVDRVIPAGEGVVAFDAGALASGVYFVRLSAGEVGVTRKVLLVR